MRDRFESRPDAMPSDVAVVRRDARVRVLNCSADGCLLEVSQPFDVGSVAALRIEVGDREFSDAVQVTRSQRVEGAGPTYHVGVKFLWTTPPYAGSLRLMSRSLGHLAGWLAEESAR